MRTIVGATPVRRRLPFLLVGAGLAIALVAGAFGYTSVSSIGQGDLTTVAAGDLVTFRPQASYRADLFTTTDAAGQSLTCGVATDSGRPVALGDAVPYAVNTRLQMVSAYGFQVTQGTTYLVTCGTRTGGGSFAVVEVQILPQQAAIAGGGLGALLVLAGIGLLLLRRLARQGWRATSPRQAF